MSLALESFQRVLIVRGLDSGAKGAATGWANSIPRH
jgi:hypothetical protein